MSEPQKWVQNPTFETPKKECSSCGIQKIKRRTTTVGKAFRASESSYLRSRAGMRLDSQSFATKRANQKPRTLAHMVPTSDSAKAVGQGQISGAATMKMVPGTPKGCSTVYARMKAK